MEELDEHRNKADSGIFSLKKNFIKAKEDTIVGKEGEVKHLEGYEDENRANESNDLFGNCNSEQSLLIKTSVVKGFDGETSEIKSDFHGRENRSPEMFETCSPAQSMIFKSARKVKCGFRTKMSEIEDDIEED